MAEEATEASASMTNMQVAMNGLSSSGGKLESLGNIFKGLGTFISNSVKEIGSFMLANPISFAVAGLAAATLVASKYVETYDTVRDKAMTSSENLSSTRTELKDIESQLDSTKSRIKELNQIEYPTLADKSELEILKQENDELERKKSILETQEKYQEKENAQNAKDALNKSKLSRKEAQKNHDKVVHGGLKEASEASKATKVSSVDKNVTENVSALKEYNKQLAKAERNQAKATPDSGEWKKQQELIDDLTDKKQKLTDSLGKDIEDLNTYRSAFINDETGNIISGYEDEVARIDDALDIYSEYANGISATKSQKLDKLFDEDAYKNAQQKIVDMFRNGEDVSLDSIKKQFPELVSACDEAGISVQELYNELQNLASSSTSTKLEDEFENFKNTAVSAINSMDVINAAMASSYSGKGLGVELDEETGALSGDLVNIANAYKGLDGYDPAVLFEKTANGVHLNREALRQLQAQQEALQKEDFINQQAAAQDRLNQALADQANTRKKYGEDSQEYKNSSLIVTDLQSQLETIRQLSSAYDGATSAYQKWLDAQSNGEEGDMFRTVSDTMKERGDQLFKEGRYNTEEFRAIADYFSFEDLDTAPVEKLVEAYQNAAHARDSYFTGNKQGIDNFMADMMKISDEEQRNWITQTEDGFIKFNTGADKAIAERFGLSTEAVQTLFRAASEYNDKIVLGDTSGMDNTSASLEEMKAKAEDAKNKLQELSDANNSGLNLDFNFDSTNIDDLDNQIERAKSNLDQFKNDSGQIDLGVEGAQDAVTILQTLIEQKQSVSQPAIMSIDTNGLDSSVADAVSKLQEYQSAVNNLSTLQQLQSAGVQVDTSQIDAAKEKVDSVFSDLQGMSQDGNLAINADVKVDTSSADALNSDLASMTPEIKAKIVPENDDAFSFDNATSAATTVNYTKGIQEPPSDKNAKVNYTKGSQKKPSNKNAKVNYKKGDQAKPKSPVTATVNYKLGAVAKPPAITVKVNYDTSGKPKFNGTANVQGSAFGMARASGDWSVKKNETSLVGELGRETIVRNGKFFTVGDRHAEFAKLKTGDIVFNHKQTEELFKNGYVTSGGGRAKVAMGARANGSAYSSGTWVFGNTGNGNIGGTGSRPSYNNSVSKKKNTQSQKAAKQSVQAAANATQDALDAITGYFDWIKVRFDRLSRETDIAEKAIDSAIGLSNKQSATSDAISKVQAEMDAAQQGANRYLEHANWFASNSGLSQDLQSRVQSGTIDISKYDDDTKKKIEEYQSYYEDYLSALDKVQDLQAKEIELAQKRLKNIEDFYDLVVSVSEAIQKANDAQLKYEDALGFSNVSDSVRKIYEDSMTEAEKVYKNSVQQLNDYQAEFNDLISKGYIKEGSDAWYEGQKKLNEFRQAVSESATTVEDFADKIRGISNTKIQNLIDGLERLSGKADKWVSLQESRDEKISESVYQEQMDTNNAQILKNKELLDNKLDEQSYYAVDSARYQDLAEEIQKLDEETLGLMIDNEKLKNSIFELRFQPLDDALSKYSALRKEIDTFQSLLNKDAFFDKNGIITEEGLANLALLQQGLSTAKKQVVDYRIGLDKLQKSYDNGVISEKELNDKTEEYRKGLQEAAVDVENYKDSLTDLYMNQMKAENDVLKEIINKRKDALKAKADYYDYDKKLRSQTKDLNSLKAQRDALSGVNNAAAQAELKRLNQQIADAEEELNETKRSHANDMQEKGYDSTLDDLDEIVKNTEYEIAHNAEKQQSVIKSMLNNVVSMYESAYGKINSIINNTGWIGSNDFNKKQEELGTETGAGDQMIDATQSQNEVKPSGNATGTVTDKINNNDKINSEIEHEIMQKPNTDNRPVVELIASPTALSIEEGKSGKISTRIRPTDAKNQTLSWNSSNESVATVSNGEVKAIKPGSAQITVSTTDGSGLSQTIGVTVTKKPDPPKPAPSPQTGGDGVPRVGDVVTLKPGERYYYDSWGSRPAGNLYSGVTNGVVIDGYSGVEYGGQSRQHGGYAIHIKGADGRYGNLGWVNVNQISGYASGTGTNGVLSEQIAEVNERGREMYITNDGRILRHMQPGDHVMTNPMTENILKWGKINPQQHLANSLRVPSNIHVPDRENNINITTHYDSLLTVNGNVDKETLPELKVLLEKSYKYTESKLYSEGKKAGLRKRL